AFALTENTLYTIEAFRDYFDHLTPRGVLTMTRTWWDGDLASPDLPGFAPESPRLILLAAGALEELGVPPREARRHLFFAAAICTNLRRSSGTPTCGSRSCWARCSSCRPAS